MLFESLNNWKRYNFGPLWTELMPWIEQNAPTLADGKYEHQGCSVAVFSQLTKPWGEELFEAHTRMVDVQMLLAGQEALYFAPLAGLHPTAPYDATRDVVFFSEMPKTGMVRLEPGYFALLMPWDAHRPSVALEQGPAPVRRLVAKIPLDALHIG